MASEVNVPTPRVEWLQERWKKWLLEWSIIIICGRNLRNLIVQSKPGGKIPRCPVHRTIAAPLPGHSDTLGSKERKEFKHSIHRFIFIRIQSWFLPENIVRHITSKSRKASQPAIRSFYYCAFTTLFEASLDTMGPQFVLNIVTNGSNFLTLWCRRHYLIYKERMKLQQ